VSQQAAKRRRKQAANGFKHLASICGKAIKGGRPRYPSAMGLSVAQAIARERQQAAREAARKGKKKK
jgi:hypothetical protein